MSLKHRFCVQGRGFDASLAVKPEKANASGTRAMAEDSLFTRQGIRERDDKEEGE